VNVDLLVLITSLKGNDSAEHLKGLLKVSTNPDGFFSEAHVKLRPLDFANEGIYVCGGARSPKDVRATIEESIGAAMRAAIPMTKEFVETEGIVSSINSDECISCGICADTCAYGAIEVIDNTSKVIQAICKGCGTCAASCPTEAIGILHYTDEQLYAQIDALLEHNPEDKILGFACHWCALGAVDNAGMSRFEYPPNIHLIRVMCAGRVDPKFILHAFSRGANGVLVAGCEMPTCHYISGNYYTQKKVQITKKLLELSGINQERLRLEWLSAAQGPKLARIVKEFNDQLISFGPVKNDGFSDLGLEAAIASATSQRLRILSTKITDFETKGNMYNEMFTHHEVQRLVDEIVYDEFITHEIILSLVQTAKSVITLADELEVTPPKILKCILDLNQSGRIRSETLHDGSVVYSLIEIEENTEKITEAETPSADSKSIPQEVDYAIFGATINSLQKALEMADMGKTVGLINPSTSFGTGNSVLTKDFTDLQSISEQLKKLTTRVFQNDNITILNNTTIEPPNDKSSNDDTRDDASSVLYLHKRPTFVDPSKCDNCGKCLDACPVKILDFNAYGLSNNYAIHLSQPEIDENHPTISKGLPYCQVSCPIKMDVRGYLGKLADDDQAGAAEVMRRTNPLPDICGKVCDHACEYTCARGHKDDPLEIRKLKRYAIEEQYEHFIKHDLPIIPRPSSLKNRDQANKIAIIGSGPAGLAAAHDLAKLGYPVTIFESLPVPGGMLRVGIPDYRLPPQALQKEVDAILGLGVELKLNTPIGKDLTISDLKDQGYKAFFISIGAHRSLKLGIHGEDFNGVINGVEFLREINLKDSSYSVEYPNLGKSVAVIGGGNVAIDCARTARRLGAENVHILYRRSKAEMPASNEELEQCIAEGIKIEYLVAPKKVLDNGNNKVKGIECQRTELGAMDTSGRRRPVPIENSEFTLDVDTILTAIGQQPDLGFLLSEDEFDLTRLGTFIVDGRSGMTNVDGVFAGGDVVTGPSNVIGAIYGGKLAARGIDLYLSGNLDNNPNIYEFSGEEHTKELELIRLRKNLYTPTPEPEQYRRTEKLLDAVQRITNFSEVELLLTDAEAVVEARRCLSCRMCIGCGVCQAVCPKGAIDYSMGDKNLEIKSGEILTFPRLTEGSFRNNPLLKCIYSDSLNAISPMELEYLLNPDGAYTGQLIRPYDGVVPTNIAMVHLPEQKLVSPEQEQLNNLEMVYILKLAKIIKIQYPEVNLKLITNTEDCSILPEQFKFLLESNSSPNIADFPGQIIKFSADNNDLKILENPETKNIEIETGGEKFSVELAIIGIGFGFEELY
jgi:NADPH-dependent glutamate synthase beta subunit-like oxidoreductase/coenzyme F420-reducing hydrogenase delta subunit